MGTYKGKAENKGGNARHGMGMLMQGISVNAGNLGENAKYVTNQSGNEGNQGGNLSIKVEMP